MYFENSLENYLDLQVTMGYSKTVDLAKASTRILHAGSSIHIRDSQTYRFCLRKEILNFERTYLI